MVGHLVAQIDGHYLQDVLAISDFALDGREIVFDLAAQCRLLVDNGQYAQDLPLQCGGQIRVDGERLHVRSKGIAAVHIDGVDTGPVRPGKVPVPVPVQGLIDLPGVLPLCLGRIGLCLCRGVRLHDGVRGRHPWHGFDHDESLAGRRVRPAFVLLACLLLPQRVSRFEHGGAAVFAGAGVQRFEFVEVLLPDAGALAEQTLIGPGPCAEGRGSLEQRRVPVECLPESGAQRHGAALGASPFTKVAPGRQHLAALRRECVHGRAVAPANHGMADLACDARKRVVVRRRTNFGRLFPSAIGSANVTNTALGWRTPANFELLIPVARRTDHVVKFEQALLAGAVRATAGQRDHLETLLKKLRDLPAFYKGLIYLT